MFIAPRKDPAATPFRPGQLGGRRHREWSASNWSVPGPNARPLGRPVSCNPSIDIAINYTAPH